ncbi:C-factor [Ophiophagus hannah]|uniref:C-factor n=1 Tax=Ophiophagus hannah TaxID=8665 RepID=V8N8Z3_OPHHA|nr:C-factor [Ophiophagus hannah]
MGLCYNHGPGGRKQPDVTKLESIQAAQKEVQKCVGEGGLTILINNAGTWAFNDLQTENAKDMMRVYSVDVIGTLQMSQAFLPLLKKAARRSPCQGLSSSKAAIINISSNGGSVELVAYWDQYKIIGYRCAKAALNMLTKCQSLEYPANGIMSIAIHPGSVETADNPNPEISVEESTQGIMTVLSKLCEGDNGTFAFLPLLKKAARRSPGQGLSSSKAAIINMSSIGGSIELMALWDQVQIIGYRCSKAALNMLTRCQSLEYSADGIMSVAFHPGIVKTSNSPAVRAEISVEESTQGILTVLSKLCEEDNGTFLDYLGRRLPW